MQSHLETNSAVPPGQPSGPLSAYIPRFTAALDSRGFARTSMVHTAKALRSLLRIKVPGEAAEITPCSLSPFRLGCASRNSLVYVAKILFWELEARYAVEVKDARIVVRRCGRM